MISLIWYRGFELVDPFWSAASSSVGRQSQSSVQRCLSTVQELNGAARDQIFVGLFWSWEATICHAYNFVLQLIPEQQPLKKKNKGHNIILVDCNLTCGASQERKQQGMHFNHGSCWFLDFNGEFDLLQFI